MRKILAAIALIVGGWWAPAAFAQVPPGEGGSSGGAVTIADCADVTQGCEADAAWVSGSGTVISLLKKIAGAGSGANASVGTIGATAPTSATYFGMLVAGNLVGVPGTANGVKTDGSAVTQPGSAASGAFVDGAIATLGLEADAACSTDIATCTAEALYKRINQRLTSLIAAVNAAALTPPLAVNPNPYPAAAVPITASATGTTAAVTATLTNVSTHTTYICGFSIRANATAATTVNATVTGTITATMNYSEWVAPLASGVGVVEQVFSPCIPASAVSTSIAVVSGAAGSGGVTSVSAWGYSL